MKTYIIQVRLKNGHYRKAAGPFQATDEYDALSYFGRQTLRSTPFEITIDERPGVTLTRLIADGRTEYRAKTEAQTYDLSRRAS